MRAPRANLLIGSLITSCLSTERIIRRSEGDEIVGANETPIESFETPKSFNIVAIAFEKRKAIVTKDDSWMIESYTYPEERHCDWKLPQFIQDSKRTRESKKQRVRRRRKSK